MRSLEPVGGCAAVDGMVRKTPPRGVRERAQIAGGQQSKGKGPEAGLPLACEQPWGVQWGKAVRVGGRGRVAEEVTRL